MDSILKYLHPNKDETNPNYRMRLRSSAYFTYLRWCVYLLWWSCHSCEGLFQYSRQSDSRYNSTILNSSPHLSTTSDSLYSSWAQWTACSVTCGLGISSRTRSCLKSVYNAKGVPVPLCHGEFTEHKICNVKSCPYDSLDVREFQCSQHDNQVVAGKFITKWQPASGGPNPCELRCEAKTEKLVYGFGKTSDGTPCPLGVCLDGRCLRIGCDERLGSGVMVDMCGVCGGRNSSCVHYKDVFQGQPSSGSSSRSTYHEVVVIPFAARNLIIRQPLGKNVLALQDRNKGIIFNGEQSLSKYGGHFEIAGSTVEFVKIENYAEVLLAKGPLTQELYVLVLLRAHNPGIYYEYWLPKQSHSLGRTHFSMRPPSYPFPPMFPTPLRGQSYTVPFHKTRVSAAPHAVRHPSKPPFAYGYGEKPYKGQESPIFRRIHSTAPPLHGKAYNPSKAFQSESPVPPNSIKEQSYPPYKRSPIPIYKARPSVDYYQTFRNLTSLNVPKVLDQTKDLPVLTQGDSSSSNGGGRYQNVISGDPAADEKKHELDVAKYPKPLKTGIVVNKRDEKLLKNYIPNGRLKYSFETKHTDEVYVNGSRAYSPAPLTINVLPESGKPKTHKDRRKDDRTQKPRLTRGGPCEPCQRNRDQTKHFCQSDFVVRASVIGYEFLQGETRYELEVMQSFKNTLSLLPKEYVWSPDTCRCPKLRTGKEYVIMGRFDSNYKKRESRLLVDKTCFVRTFNLKYARRLQKLRKDQEKKCKKIS